MAIWRSSVCLAAKAASSPLLLLLLSSLLPSSSIKRWMMGGVVADDDDHDDDDDDDGPILANASSSSSMSKPGLLRLCPSINTLRTSGLTRTFCSMLSGLMLLPVTSTKQSSARPR